MQNKQTQDRHSVYGSSSQLNKQNPPFYFSINEIHNFVFIFILVVIFFVSFTLDTVLHKQYGLFYSQLWVSHMNFFKL